MKQSNIGLIGLGVMGENLALNMERNGWQVSVWNRTVKGVEEGVVDRFMEGRGKGKNIIGCEELDDFADTLSRPRVVMMMVKAGKAVDDTIERLVPYLSQGDIVIDGGNSNFEDTARRVKNMEERGFYFIGAGVSGGEEGALNGASIMPGGSVEAWPVVRPILQSIAAKAEDGSPCCEWIGPGGSGHFVKMVHNGIEYGDMQLISEAYFLMHRLLQLTNEEMGEIFSRWNEGKLKSYLIEITGHIFRHKDATGEYLIDMILDVAGQKGTGKWSVINALDLGMPLDLIAAAVFARNLSAEKTLREKASRAYQRSQEMVVYDRENMLKAIHDTLYASKLVSYAQGFSMLKRASEVYHWDLNLSAIALIWRGGCIIRSAFLDDIAEAFREDQHLADLLLAPVFEIEIVSALPSWKRTVNAALTEGLAVPAFSSALNYFYALTTENSPANLIQAQRDYFGAHTYERVDEKRGEFFHEDWTGQGGKTTAGIYEA